MTTRMLEGKMTDRISPGQENSLKFFVDKTKEEDFKDLTGRVLYRY